MNNYITQGMIGFSLSWMEVIRSIFCPECHSDKYVKAWNACGGSVINARDVGVSLRDLFLWASLETKKLALYMVTGGVGFRSISRILKKIGQPVSDLWVGNWVRKYGAHPTVDE